MRVEPKRIVYRADSRADRWVEEVEEARWLDTWNSHMHIGEDKVGLVSHDDCTSESHDADQRKARLAIAGEHKPYAVIFFGKESEEQFKYPPINVVGIKPPRDTTHDRYPNEIPEGATVVNPDE